MIKVLSTNKCLKEWNAIIEALGQGKQTVLIRSYGTALNGFLLYPSVRYSNKVGYLDNFQPEFKSFVENNALPEKEEDKVAIKYYVIVEKIVEKSSSAISRLQENYIYTNEHVRKYLKGKKAIVWILRVYKLNKPFMAEPTPGAITYVNLKEEVSLEGMVPVLNDSEFNKILDSIV